MSPRKHDQAAVVKVAILAALPQLVRQWLPYGEQQGETYVALNPMRNDRNLGSFRIDTHDGQWWDHAIGQGGSDAISLYAYLSTGRDYREAYKRLANDPLVRAAMATGATAPPAIVAVPLRDDPAKLALVRQLYAQAGALPGTPAAAYLQNRGLGHTDAWDRLRASVLRHPMRGPCPVLMAPIDGPDGSMVGLHRTYLQPNGTKLDVANPRMTLGQVRGGAVRLAEAIDQLIICEGLEDGLTLYQELGIPVWVACGAGLMRHMVIPDTVQTLTIAADNDAPGELAAQRAAEAHHIGGKDVRVMRPDPAFKDFNDHFQGIRK